MISCPNCGGTNPAEARFCNLCLTPFGAGAPAAENPFATPQPPPAAPPPPGGFSGVPPVAPPPPPGGFGGVPPASPYGTTQAPGAWGPPGKPVTPAKEDSKIPSWAVFLLVAIPVVLIALGVVVAVNRPAPGGTVTMGELALRYKRPDGWKDITNDPSAQKSAGFEANEIRALGFTLDSILIGKNDRFMLIMSTVPDDAISVETAGEDLAHGIPGTKIIEPVSQVAMGKGYGYKITIQGSERTGLFGNVTDYKAVFVVFESNGKIGFWIAGGISSKWDQIGPEIDSMITSVETTDS